MVRSCPLNKAWEVKMVLLTHRGGSRIFLGSVGATGPTSVGFNGHFLVLVLFSIWTARDFASIYLYRYCIRLGGGRQPGQAGRQERP